MGCCNSTEGTDGDKNGQVQLPTKSPEVNVNEKKHFVENVVIGNVDLDIEEVYSMDEIVLGTGASGTVKICTHKLTGIQYALKSLNTRKVTGEKLAQLRDEIKMMARLDHPNILRIHEVFEARNCIFLVLDLCRGGELLDRLHKQAGHHYSERVACQHVRTMLSAIAYCHSHNIVHRDLKLENFLFISDDPDSELVLIDFGLSHFFKPQEVMHSAVGTPYYVAPEVLAGSYNSKCDVWSIGVIAYMLLSGSPPFYGKTDADTLRSVQLGRFDLENNKLFTGISVEAKRFISDCLRKQVSKRLTAAEALNHSWFDMLRGNNASQTATTASAVTLTDSSNAATSIEATSAKNVSLHTKSESSNQCSTDINTQQLLPTDTLSRLKGFVARPTLAKICMDVVAHTLQPEQIQDLRQQFAKFDVRNTGEISIADVRTVLVEHGEFAEEDLHYIFSGVDLEKADTMSYHEFLAATISYKTITQQNLRVAFEMMSHHNEYITREDVENLLGSDSQNVGEVADIFKEMNLAPNAKINFEKFQEIMNGGAHVSQGPTTKSPSIKSPMSLASPYRSSTRKKLFFESSPSNSPAASRDPSVKKSLSHAGTLASNANFPKSIKSVAPIMEIAPSSPNVDELSPLMAEDQSIINTSTTAVAVVLDTVLTKTSAATDSTIHIANTSADL